MQKQAAAIRVLDRSTDDIDDQDVMLQDWDQNYTQLETGHFAAQGQTYLSEQDIRLFRKTTNRKMRKVFANTHAVTWVAVSLPGSELASFNGSRVQAGDFFLIHPDTQYELACTGGFDVIAIPLQIQSERDKHWLKTEQSIVFTPELSHAAYNELSRALTEQNLGKVEQTIYCGLPLPKFSMQEGGMRARSNANRVSEAMKLVESRLRSGDNIPSSLELANQVGTSVRSLEYAFTQRYSVPPSRYFKCVRLHGARRDIRDSGMSVTEAAMKWGFAHLGRFSSSYYEFFGELPSQTTQLRIETRLTHPH